MLKPTILILSYFIGAIPFGYIVGRTIKKNDIRKFGSGNVGATNVVRVVGKKWGIAVFVFDFLKGFNAPLLMKIFVPAAGNSWYILAALAAVCGHNWTPFLGFKGGKGVATSLGALVSLSLIFPALWLAVGVGLLLWCGVFVLTKIVSLSSILSGIGFFIAAMLLDLPVELRILSFVFLVLILFRHKNNIKNLLSRKENKFL